MTEGLNHGIAFVAGVLSFLSPCILPLIPSYLSLIGGTSVPELQESGVQRWGVFTNTVFFVVGFSVVFIALGIVFSSTIGLFGGGMRIVNIVAGLIVIALGVNVIFDFWQILNVERRLHLNRKPTGSIGALLFGMAFGAGWTPCVGPILGSILILAGTSGNLMRGLSMLSVFSLGLGVPFLLTGLFFSVALKQIGKLKPYLNKIRIASGAFLIAIGVLILLGRLQRFNSVLFSFAYTLETFEGNQPLAARLVFGAVFLLLTGMLSASYWASLRRRQAENEKPRLLRPVRLFLMFLFAAASVLSFSGLISISGVLSAWLTFQGI